MASNSVGFTHGDRRLDRQHRGGVRKIEEVYRTCFSNVLTHNACPF